MASNRSMVNNGEKKPMIQIAFQQVGEGPLLECLIPPFTHGRVHRPQTMSACCTAENHARCPRALSGSSPQGRLVVALVHSLEPLWRRMTQKTF